MPSVSFTVPLPPVSLRANSRAHWARKKKDADAYSEVVCTHTLSGGCDTSMLRTAYGLDVPWKEADVHYEWRYAGVEPDHSNLGGHTKYLQDIIAMAPTLSPKQAEKYKRWHLGLVENDSGIHATFRAVKVPKKSEECVVVTVTRRPA